MIFGQNRSVFSFGRLYVGKYVRCVNHKTITLLNKGTIRRSEKPEKKKKTEQTEAGPNLMRRNSLEFNFSSGGGAEVGHVFLL